MSEFKFTVEEVKPWCVKHNIPEYMHEGIIMYLVHHGETGDFLRSVFENSLMDAIRCADDVNQQNLKSYAALLYWELPGRGQEGSPWGSREAVKAWLKR